MDVFDQNRTVPLKADSLLSQTKKFYIIYFMLWKVLKMWVLKCVKMYLSIKYLFLSW